MGPTRRLPEDEVQRRRRNRERAEVEILEKDDTERQLERLLFGDEAGFLDALKEPAISRETALERLREQDDEGSEKEIEDENLEDVPDEDVSSDVSSECIH